MKSETAPEARVNPFNFTDVQAILRERAWLQGEATPEITEWMRDAADWIGPHAASREGTCEQQKEVLGELLELVFSYDAVKLLEKRENQAIMTQEGARDVIREIANRVFDAGEIDSERLRGIIDALKRTFGSRGRRIFHPLRLALAGKAGEGELDRVILLLDRAAKLPFSVTVKGTRQRMLEFCAALR